MYFQQTNPNNQDKEPTVRATVDPLVREFRLSAYALEQVKRVKNLIKNEGSSKVGFDSQNYNFSISGELVGGKLNISFVDANSLIYVFDFSQANYVRQSTVSATGPQPPLESNSAESLLRQMNSDTLRRFSIREIKENSFFSKAKKGAIEFVLPMKGSGELSFNWNEDKSLELRVTLRKESTTYRLQTSNIYVVPNSENGPRYLLASDDERKLLLQILTQLK